MLRRTKEIALWIGAILGSLTLLWTAVMFAFGLTPLVFTSGSMSPEIKAGDLAFSRTVDAGQINVGDVISLENAAGVRITHRVVDIDTANGDAVLTMKGDANKAVDAEAYNVTAAERVEFSVPKAGYVVNWASSPTGMFLGGMFVTVLLFIAFVPTARDGEERPPVARSDDQIKTSKPGHRRKGIVLTVAGVAVVSVAAVGALLVRVEPTSASFTDVGTMNTSAIASSAAPPRPTSMSCTTSGNWLSGYQATFTWPAYTDSTGRRVGYRVQIADNASWNNATNVTILPTGASSYSFTANSSIGGWFSATTYYVRVQAAYVDGNNAFTWFAVDHRAWTATRTVVVNWFECASNLTP